MTDSTITLNGQQAAVHFAAIDVAIANAKDVLERNSKQSQPYRGAVANLLAQYEQERVRLTAAFPVLVNGNAT